MAHSSQAVCAALLCWPAAQVVHPVLGSALVVRMDPGKHCVHEDAPEVKVVVPLGHDSQAVLSVLGSCPIRHSLQLSSSASNTCPGLQTQLAELMEPLVGVVSPSPQEKHWFGRLFPV